MIATTLDVYVFVLAFAAAFLLGGKRPCLALSTRALLVALLALALGYAEAPDGQWYREYLGFATLVANALFVAFAALDFAARRKHGFTGD